MNENKITELLYKSEISSVINSYFRALDEKNFDSLHFANIFTVDGKIMRPNGMSVTGPEEISASHAKSFSHFESTQHLLVGHDISIVDNMASVRVNLVAMHVYEGSNQDASRTDNFFIAGGVVAVKLEQVEDRWKILLLSNDSVWRAGNSAKLLAIFKSMPQSE